MAATSARRSPSEAARDPLALRAVSIPPSLDALVPPGPARPIDVVGVGTALMDYLAFAEAGLLVELGLARRA